MSARAAQADAAEPDLWRALASPWRRRLLDLLRDAPATTGALASQLPELSRFAVMQHLGVLADAGVVVIERRGRDRVNHLNPVPLREWYERWVQPMADTGAAGLLALRRAAETGEPLMPEPVDQIRTVLETFRDRLPTEIFPGRTEVPKTLIFAKDDAHADEIVQIAREVFGKGNEFAAKITYKSGSQGQRPEDLLASFRNSYNPRIAVTVDMIATGTDIKPLEIVMFMRAVKSRTMFEQMKGRGARTVTATELQNVTPDGRSKDQVFALPRLIAFICASMTLEPGDLISTGTPAGVAPLRAGEVVEVEIEGVGVLRNEVRAL